MKVRISTASIGSILAEISEALNPRTAKAIVQALPIRGSCNRWGDEIYFGIDVSVPEENSKQVVERGALAYWPPGQAFCIFFGPTPASKGAEPRAASPVNVFGRVLDDFNVFKKVKNGEEITISKSE
jgi:hypothetical protein